jgi:recombination protein RecA
VAALVPKGELDGEMGDAHMAMQARLMSQALRKLSHSLSLSQSILIFINQVSAKIVEYTVGNLPFEICSAYLFSLILLFSFNLSSFILYKGKCKV